MIRRTVALLLAVGVLLVAAPKPALADTTTLSASLLEESPQAILGFRYSDARRAPDA